MRNTLKEIADQLLAIDEDMRKRAEAPIDCYDLEMFEQTWGSTALGFGGMGGQAMTSAMTYVLIPSQDHPAMLAFRCFVYFAGEFAYAVPYSETFMDDVRRRRMRACYESGVYLRAADRAVSVP